MAQAVPTVVLAAPGAGGAQLALALAAATKQPLAAWDEVSDEPLGDGHVVRTACREVLWRRERDWTCPPAELEVDERDAALVAPLRRLLASEPAPVLHDVALPFLLPLLRDVCEELLVVVAVRDPREALPHLLSGQDLESGAADELLRAANQRLATLATADGVSIVGLRGGVDLSAVATELASSGTAPGPRTLPTVEPEVGVEEDPAADALFDRADARPPHPVKTDALLATQDEAGPLWLDRYGGPRTAARRALLHGMAAVAGPGGPLLECTRARGLGAWLVTDMEVRVAVVDDVATMQRAITVPPASQGVVLLSDVTSWCRSDELRPVLELAMEAVRFGGTIVVGRSAADDDHRRLCGLDPLDDDEVATAARELGLVPLPTRGCDVRGLCFAAQTAVAVTIRNLEDRISHLEEHLADREQQLARRTEQLEQHTQQLARLEQQLTQRTRQVERRTQHLARRTEQRDAVVARYDALRRRRSVRAALGVADTLGRAVRRLRGDSSG